MDYCRNILKNVKEIDLKYWVIPILIIIYIISRPVIIFYYVVSLVSVLVFYYLYKNSSEKFINFLIKYLKFGLILLTLIIFVGSFYYSRFNSFDAQLWYLKRVLLLKDDFFLHFTNLPHPPYPLELLLSFIWKYIGKGFVFSSFFIVSIVNIILLKKLYFRLDFSESKRNFLIFIFVTTPAFLDLAMFQFKVEPFLLLFTLLSILSYLDIRKKYKLSTYILFGIFSGISILIKISTAPFFAFLMFFHFLENIRIRKYKQSFYTFIPMIIVLLIFSLWTYKYGIGVPWTNINIFPPGNGPVVNFEKDGDVYVKCLRQQKVVDFSSFIDDRSFKDFLAQPCNYLFNIKNFISILSLSDPGLYFYLAIILFIPLTLFNREYRKMPLFLSTMAYLIYFYIDIRTIFWYLFFLFPLIGIPIYDKLFSGKKALINRLMIISLGVTIFLLFLARYPFLTTQRSDLVVANEYVSSKLNKTEGLILDATPFPLQVFLTFLDDYDKRVVRDSLYFGYTKKNNDEIYQELKENNIKYIVFRDSEVKRIEFFGCPEEHIFKLKEFVSEYGNFLFADLSYGTWVYEIL